MKKIAVLTDFSERSSRAAAYALSLAAQLQADVLLCHSFLVPAADPVSAQVAWPMEDYNEIKTSCEAELTKLKTQLESKLNDLPAGFRPKIECRAQDGAYNVAVNEFLSDKEVILLVMDNHHQGFSTLIMGNHTREVLDHSILPLLVVPEHAAFKKIAKIAFATDLQEDDLQVLQSLSGFARPFDAEILLMHIDKPVPEDHQAVRDFLQDVTNKINYPHIYYRQLTEKHLQEGLRHLAATVHADLVVTVHRHKDFLSRLFGGSQTQKLASETTLPLLIFPCPAERLPVF